MLINAHLRNLTKRRKLKKIIREIYAQKDSLTRHIPIWQEGRTYLSISKRGFCYHNLKSENMCTKDAGGLLKHIPGLDIYLFVYYTPSEYLTINKIHFKNLLDLFDNLDPEQLRTNFYRQLKDNNIGI